MANVTGIVLTAGVETLRVGDLTVPDRVEFVSQSFSLY